MRSAARERIIRSIEYHEGMARYHGGDEHVENYRQRREENRKASEAQHQVSEQGEDQDTSQRRRTLDEGDSEQQTAAPEKDERSAEQILADTHADAACQLRELLATQPPEPAIHRARRERDATGTVPRTGQPRPRFAS